MLKASLTSSSLMLALGLAIPDACARVQQLPGFAGQGKDGKETSIAVDINAHGQVAALVEDEDGKQRAVLYDTGVLELGTLGGRSSAATAINDAGQVAGASEMPDRRWHAFLYDDGKMVDLGALIGYGNSYATSINAAGHVVGTILVGEERRSFVYRDGRMLVHQSGKGLYLTNAINDQDLVIGATDFSKRYAAATMNSDMVPVVPRGHREFMGMMTLAIATALGLMLLRRRYRGIALARY